MTDQQVQCVEMLAEWVGGFHHLPKVKEFGDGVAINFSGDLSTYDFNRLTMLVLLAHRDAIRIEIASSGPRLIKIIAHKRKPMVEGMKQWERHPTLADLIQDATRIERSAEAGKAAK